MCRFISSPWGVGVSHTASARCASVRERMCVEIRIGSRKFPSVTQLCCLLPHVSSFTSSSLLLTSPLSLKIYKYVPPSLLLCLFVPPFCAFQSILCVFDWPRLPGGPVQSCISFFHGGRGWKVFQDGCPLRGLLIYEGPAFRLRICTLGTASIFTYKQTILYVHFIGNVSALSDEAVLSLLIANGQVLLLIRYAQPLITRSSSHEPPCL